MKYNFHMNSFTIASHHIKDEILRVQEKELEGTHNETKCKYLPSYQFIYIHTLVGINTRSSFIILFFYSFDLNLNYNAWKLNKNIYLKYMQNNSAED